MNSGKGKNGPDINGSSFALIDALGDENVGAGGRRDLGAGGRGGGAGGKLELSGAREILSLL